MKMKHLLLLLTLSVALAIFTPPILQTYAKGPPNSYITKSDKVLVAQAADNKVQSVPESQVTPTDAESKPPVVAPATEKPLPAEGAGLWEWILWFIGIIGFSTIVRIFFRFIPSAINVDWVGYLIQMLDYILGKWIPNRTNTQGKLHK